MVAGERAGANLRRAVMTDAGIIAAYNIVMAEETEGKALDPATVLAGVEALLADPAKGFYLVAEMEGRVVGQAMVTYEWSDWWNGSFWWVQSVYVHPDVRRQGIFSGIFREIERGARKLPGVVGLRLYVDAENLRAQEAYRRLGMDESNYLMFERGF
ncbi:MAG: GNAT family N-acetyltransferase [Methanofollis sp.]|uniref:GNAT family N-acetyltransferase n=1 Tax=Methanofollis sp. TaxID=2052835 RepID=UPI002607E232|nr:GNAT family N-acetyltransferase [Methanofollis sp.]MDD4255115.1 GNAT family N-acetyltransferase [Methanofollis sp.]